MNRSSAETGWPGVSMLRVVEIEEMVCNFSLSVAARTLVRADPSLRYTSILLGREATNKQTILEYGSPGKREKDDSKPDCRDSKLT